MKPASLAGSYTADEFYRLPVERAELVRGEVITRRIGGAEHGDVVTRTLCELLDHAERTKAGWVTAACGFLLAQAPDSVRVPDIAFVACSRVPRPLPAAYVPFAPDLAVEVVAPDDTESELQDKVDEYLAAAVREVWVIDPRRRRVQVQAPGQVTRTLGPGESLTTPLLAGLALELDSLFPPKAP